MQRISTLCKDFVASHLRCQIATLQGVLDNIESSNRIEGDYVEEAFRRVEVNLRQLRRFLCG
jgi:hypothetical protein